MPNLGHAVLFWDVYAISLITIFKAMFSKENVDYTFHPLAMRALKNGLNMIEHDRLYH